MPSKKGFEIATSSECGAKNTITARSSSGSTIQDRAGQNPGGSVPAALPERFKNLDAFAAIWNSSLKKFR